MNNSIHTLFQKLAKRSLVYGAIFMLTFSFIYGDGYVVAVAADDLGAPAADEEATADEDGKKIDLPFFSGNDILFWDPDAKDCAVGGGGTGGPANIDVDVNFSLGDDPGQRPVNLVRALMKDFGLSGEQASGIVGNFMHESGGKHVPPDVNEGGNPGPPRFSGGYGWAQWTGPRQRTFISFAVDNGFMASPSVNATDAANYAYLKHELTTGYTSTIEQIRTKNTPRDAAVSFEATFEKAGVPALGPRIAGAEEVFAALNGGSVDVGGGGGAAGGAAPNCSGGGGQGIVGDKAFPLTTTKADMESQNRGMFANGNTSKGGHPYTAFDILAKPGTEVVAFIGGTVTTITQDRCPGRMISIYNQEADLTVSYLHNDMNPGTHVAKGDTVQPGQHVAVVGPAGAGCGTPHLHIDAAQGNSRPGCSRLNCPASNASKFVDIGPDLFTTFEALP